MLQDKIKNKPLFSKVCIFRFLLFAAIFILTSIPRLEHNNQHLKILHDMQSVAIERGYSVPFSFQNKVSKFNITEIPLLDTYQKKKKKEKQDLKHIFVHPCS